MADISMEEPLGEGSTLGEFEDEPPKSSPRSDPATLTDDGLEAEASTSNAHALSSSEIRPQKRRRASYEEKMSVPLRSRYYLGTFFVSNAWSTTKGTGYIKNGDPILIERETLQDDRSFSKDAAKKGKGKQMTLNNLFKIRASATKKTKSNIIVRLTNARGFGEYPTIAQVRLSINHVLLQSLEGCLLVYRAGYLSSWILVKTALRILCRPKLSVEQELSILQGVE